MMYLKNPESLAELREYLTTFDKRQREPENNVDLPFSQYAWSGGFIWTQIPGERVKSYLDKYEPVPNVLAKVSSGNMGEHLITVSDVKGLKVGDIVELQLFNKDGENGEIIVEHPWLNDIQEAQVKFENIDPFQTDINWKSQSSFTEQGKFKKSTGPL